MLLNNKVYKISRHRSSLGRLEANAVGQDIIKFVERITTRQ